MHNNGGKAPLSVQIIERSLTNNQDYSEMLENKFKWKSADGEEPRLAQPYPEDPSKTVIALQPQRIRVFKVVYSSVTEQED